MAMRGPCIGQGYVEGHGTGKVFTDLDNTSMLFFVPDKGGDERYVSRGRVQFRPSLTTKRRTQSAGDDTRTGGS